MVAKILNQIFKYAVMTFSASMTVYSLYSAFDGGVLGWLFGFAGIAVFEAAALYWQAATKAGREGQIIVAQIAQWATMALSLISTLVGIALLTEWGSTVRDALPLGVIMIAVIGIGLAVNMFAFLAFEDEEPEAKRLHQERMIEAEFSNMIYEGDKRALSAARIEMEKKISKEAPLLGARLADSGVISVKEHNAPRLRAPESAKATQSPWEVVSNPPVFAMGGGSAQSPRVPDSPARNNGMNSKPASPVDFYQDDEEGEAEPPKEAAAWKPRPLSRPVPTPAEMNERMSRL